MNPREGTETSDSVKLYDAVVNVMRIESPRGDGNPSITVSGYLAVSVMRIESPRGDGNLLYPWIIPFFLPVMRIESPRGDGNHKFSIKEFIYSVMRIESPRGDGNEKGLAMAFAKKGNEN